MDYISMFSGIEAASVAFGPLGWTPICFAEIEAFPAAVLAHHYPDVPNVGDMTAHDWRRYRGRCDLLVGGPPCQAFSVAGLRRSLDDDRGNLSLAYMKAHHAIDPLWSITENVPGWLSTKDNAFGCFLAGLVGEDAELLPPGGRWTDAGVASGPERTAAWRILDAQYFGLAQRRRRVFVVSIRGSGNWRCTAALFPVGESVPGNPPPRRETGEDVAGTLKACAGKSGTPNGAEEADRLIVSSPQAFGGNNTAGPIDISTALNSHGGPHGRQDFESETFIAHTLAANSGRLQVEQTYVTHSLRAEGFDASEDGTGRGIPLVPMVFGAQTSTPHWQSDICDTLQVKNPKAVAFSCKDHGAAATDDLAPTMRANGDAHSGFKDEAGLIPVAFNLRGRDDGSQPEMTDVASLRAASGGSSRSYVAQSAVRRLMPVECCRLQGFPDGYLDVLYRGKPAADGPKYKALGNSFAVPVVRWLGERIELVSSLMSA